MHLPVLFKKIETGIPVKWFQKVPEVLASAEPAVELLVTEANECVVRNGAAVIDSVDVCPQAGTEAHCAGFAGSVEFAAFEVEGAKSFAGFPQCDYFPVGCRVVVPEDTVVRFCYDDSPSGNDSAERASVVGADTFTCGADGRVHEIVSVHIFCFFCKCSHFFNSPYRRPPRFWRGGANLLWPVSVHESEKLDYFMCKMLSYNLLFISYLFTKDC